MELLDGVDIQALRIVRYPAPVLRRPARLAVPPFDGLAELAAKMCELMRAAGGVGLAAPQVGLPIRLFVANPAGPAGAEDRAFVNPEIVDRQGQLQEEEGCLSVPGVNGRIKRSAGVTIRAVGLDGRSFQQTGEGLLARVFQHEMDHLDGTLILDRMSALARLANRRTLRDLEAEYRQP